MPSPFFFSFSIVLILAEVSEFLVPTNFLKVPHLKKLLKEDLPQKGFRAFIFLQTHIQTLRQLHMDGRRK